MRLLLVALLAACSFQHGKLPATSGDGGPTDDASDASDAPFDGPRVATKKLVFNNSASSVTFDNFLVLVALDASKIDYGLVTDPTTDLRFEYAAGSGTIGANVPFEIEKWDPSGESIVWIRVPQIAAGSTTTAVLMHYGPGAGGLASASATWNGWELVNHMATGLTSSAGSYTPTPVNLTFQPGQVGESIVVGATSNSGMTFANGGALFNGWSAFTLQFWLYANYNNSGELTNEPAVMEKGTSLTLGRLYEVSGSEIRFQVDLHFTGNSAVYAIVTNVPPKTWTLCTIAFDGNTVFVARNGGAFGTADVSGNNQSLESSNMPFYLGSSNNAFKGQIDELRIERRSRTNDYVRAQYLTMTRQFVTFTDP